MGDGGRRQTALDCYIHRIVSGGQSGVDRAALDVALSVGTQCGGWCPKGRRAEDGAIPPRYRLRETPSPEYRQRTEWNVRDSDGTLVIAWGQPAGGTALALRYANHIAKPCLVVDPRDDRALPQTVEWVRHRGIRALNVAGPRQSEAPEAYPLAREFLMRLLEALCSTGA